MFKIYWLLWIGTLIILNSWAKPAPHYCSFLTEGTVRCVENISDNYKEKNVTTLQVIEFNSEILDLNRIVNNFPMLRNLSIVKSNVSTVLPLQDDNLGQEHMEVKNNQIEILRLENLFITRLSSHFLSNFPHLEILSLKGNHLTALPAGCSFNGVKEVYLKGNRWNCSENLDWVLKLNTSVVKDFDHLTCYGNPHAGKPLSAVARYYKDLRNTCDPRCDCSLEKVTITDISASESELMPIIMMNCSGRGLTELPPNLPNYTRILHVEGNIISDVEPLRSNMQYRGVWDLYLDNNEVTSIRVLEGSYWLTHFRTFSLKGNKMAKLPCYALDNAFLKNPNMPITRIFLGGNPWLCDCTFTPVFQELVLRKYAGQVIDSLDVKCSNEEGDPQLQRLPILELTRSSVCRLPAEYSLQQGLDLLNAVLASLIVFILGKLAYDYYHFKKTGRLPWIIMKMP